jgi:hypothetical protein
VPPVNGEPGMAVELGRWCSCARRGTVGSRGVVEVAVNAHAWNVLFFNCEENLKRRYGKQQHRHSHTHTQKDECCEEGERAGSMGRCVCVCVRYKRDTTQGRYEKELRECALCRCASYAHDQKTMRCRVGQMMTMLMMMVMWRGFRIRAMRRSKWI